jgi:hypothetical protein
VAVIIYRKLDENGDYMFGRRDEFYSDVEAVAQAVKTRLLHFRGEWWENVLDGTPFFQDVAGQFFASINAARRVDLIFSQRINGTMGVVEITEFDSRIDPQTRTYSASVSVRTIYDAVFQLNIIGGSGGLLDITIQGG